jgi:hypothetical protein
VSALPLLQRQFPLVANETAEAPRAAWRESRPTATFSDCGRYRYTLSWPTGVEPAGNAIRCCFILANPSTATPEKPDPTVTRCIGYARRWGYAWCDVVNVRAWRETIPKLVPADPLAIGPDNDRYIVYVAREAHLIVAGWGKLGGARGIEVLRLLRREPRLAGPYALKLNGDGSPAHPLYLASRLQPFVMPEVA